MAGPAHPAGLTDSDILIDAARGVADAVSFLAAQRAGPGVRVSVISAMELITGCRNKAELTQLQQFLQQVAVLALSSTASQNAHQLMESLFLGHGLLIPDALIAATALEEQLTLHTKNVRHFQMIPGLIVIRPY